ncbi:MAG TPA: cytochrome c peroxidase [Acidiferrobacterales bacterium]
MLHSFLQLLFAVTLATLPFKILNAADFNGLGIPPYTDRPVDSRYAEARIALGKRLFFDSSLSADGRVSCASCHRPDKAFSDGESLARGAGGKTGTRNTPSLFNVAYATSLFWDGRRTRLEDQVLDPFVNPVEHGLADRGELLGRLTADKSYGRAFADSFGPGSPTITAERIGAALAAYLRSLRAGNTPFDRHVYGADTDALSPEAQRGLGLFRSRAGCAECHLIGKEHALLTDGKFHSIGVGMETIRGRLSELTARAVAAPRPLDHVVLQDPELAQLGRFLVTHDPRDIGKFKTPSLRNVALTAPYMHDGSVATLEEAVEREIYYRGLTSGRPVVLTPDEKRELVSFLRSLTSRHLMEATRNEQMSRP